MARSWSEEDYEQDANAREWSALAQEIMRTEGVDAAEATRRASSLMSGLREFAQRWNLDVLQRRSARRN